MQLVSVSIDKPESINFIFGQTHFIKSVEDIHETLVGAVPGIRFGLAFCEASGNCLVRCSGTDDAMLELASRNAQAIGAGHSFIIFLGEGFYPVNVLNSLKRHDVQGTVRANVEAGATVNTDSYLSYVGLSEDFVHNFVDHAETYAKGNVHTNGLENFWSLLKRAIKGTYVSVEPFHLFRYLDEQSFRFNERAGDDASRFVVALKGILNKRLTYKVLTGHGDLQTC